MLVALHQDHIHHDREFVRAVHPAPVRAKRFVRILYCRPQVSVARLVERTDPN